LPERFVFQRVLPWRKTGTSIAGNAEICVRIAAISVLTQETSDQIDAMSGQMLVSGIETFLSLEKTGMRELHPQNCAVTGETLEATRAISGKTVAI
jgi:hypothetical protein